MSTQNLRDLDDYKSMIDLEQFILSFNPNWTRDKNKSTRNTPCLVNSATGQRILIYRPKSKPHTLAYMDIDNNSSYSLSIIDFVQKEKGGPMNFSLGKVRGLLDGYMGNPTYQRKPDIINSEINEFKLDHYKLSSYTKRDYLHNRGINNDTIESKYFKNTVVNSEYSPNGQIFKNTAFLKLDKNGIAGITVKYLKRQPDGNYSSIKNNFGNHGESLTTSKNNSAKWDKLLLFETVEKAMAFHQLHSEKVDKLEVDYQTTEGSLTSGHIELLRNKLEEKQVKNLVLGFDNDTAGSYFRVKLLGEIQLSEKLLGDIDPKMPDVEIRASQIKSADLYHKMGRLDFVFGCKDKEDGIRKITELKDMFEGYNKENNQKYVEETPFTITMSKEGSNNMVVGTISFRNIQAHWEHVGDFIQEMKFDNSPFFEREISLNKDFNDDLTQSIKEIKKPDIQPESKPNLTNNTITENNDKTNINHLNL